MKTCSSIGVKNWKQAVLAAVAFVVIAQVVNTIGAILMMGYYTNPAYFPLWSKLMMPNSNGPPGADFYIVSVFSNFVTGLIFAAAYSLVANNLPGTDATKGVNYGIFLFFVVGVPFTLSIKLLFAVPGALLVGWLAESLVTYTIAGAAFSKIVVE